MTKSQIVDAMNNLSFLLVGEARFEKKPLMRHCTKAELLNYLHQMIAVAESAIDNPIA